MQIAEDEEGQDGQGQVYEDRRSAPSDNTHGTTRYGPRLSDDTGATAGIGEASPYVARWCTVEEIEEEKDEAKDDIQCDKEVDE